MRKLTVTFTLIGVAVSSAAAIATASGATATTQTERFTLIDTSTTAGPPAYSVVATGAFVAGGTAARSNGTLTLNLPLGTITLNGTKHHRQETKTQTATACLQTASTMHHLHDRPRHRRIPRHQRVRAGNRQ